jgi:hypothetical protein
VETETSLHWWIEDWLDQAKKRRILEEEEKEEEGEL